MNALNFNTGDLRYRAVERYAGAYVDPRAFYGSPPEPDHDTPPLLRYIAKRMALVATPYWPCTDLPDASH